MHQKYNLVDHKMFISHAASFSGFKDMLIIFVMKKISLLWFKMTSAADAGYISSGMMLRISWMVEVAVSGNCLIIQLS